MAKVQGTCDSKFEPVKHVFSSTFDTGERGASVCVNIDGHDVLDLWGGYADAASTKPWEKDTIVNVWSNTKNISSLATLMLIDRGLIDPNEKVSKYWPEFGQNGKENVKVWHFLSHSSGVPAWEKGMTKEGVCDVKSSTEALAKQAPWWEPGTASAYHALTFGHLLGELVRRVTGKSLTEFVATEISEPLKADFQIGCKEADWGRIGELTPPPSMEEVFGVLPPDSMPVRVFLQPAGDVEFTTTELWKKAEIGGANGHGNARSLNRALRVIPLGGTSDGVKILSQKTIDSIFDEKVYGPDQALGIPISFGLGYGINGPAHQTLDWLPEGKIAFWGGWGGSFTVLDTERKLTFTYVMNKMMPGTIGNERAQQLVKATYAVLGINLGVPAA